jgi:hypothetical protein
VKDDGPGNYLGGCVYLFIYFISRRVCSLADIVFLFYISRRCIPIIDMDVYPHSNSLSFVYFRREAWVGLQVLGKSRGEYNCG